MAERPVYPKTGCCVPFCRRTSRRFPGEWICGDHWKLVPRSQKSLRTRIRARFRKRWEKLKAERDMQPVDSKARYMANRKIDTLDQMWTRIEDRIWARMKKAAIEKATGI